MNRSARPQSPASHQEPTPAERWLLFSLLALTLVRGILYLAVMPPWQHYDEPTHFEYARLIAERRRLPQPDDYDLEMRREIAASMKAANFWKDLGNPTIDLWSGKLPWIGVSELRHPPTYYALLALPQILVRHQDVETQLYLARLESVLLYVLTVASAYGLLREILPRRRWLPLAVTTFITLLPPFTDLMSAVNSDVGAAAAVTLLLWASMRLIRRGPSLVRIATLLILAAVCATVKSTAGVIAVATLLALGFGFVPRPKRRWLWMGLALLAPVVLMATFTWGEQAAYWYSDAPPATANRAMTSTLLGRFSFVLSAEGGPVASTLFQELDQPDSRSLQGHMVTLGAWLKAAEAPDVAVTLRLRDGRRNYSQEIQATSDWQFRAFTATVGVDAPGLAAYVMVPDREKGSQTIYVDGIVLVDGMMPVNQSPSFETSQAAGGQWGTQPFTNLLRNSSAEKSWPGLRSWLGSVRTYEKPVSMIFHSALDWSRTAWVYPQELFILLRSFWGMFGWGHLNLPTAFFYALGILTALALVGSGVGLVRRARLDRKNEPWRRRAWGVLGVAMLIAWGEAIARIHPVFATAHIRWPVARYAVVGIVPTALLLILGWAELVPRRWEVVLTWLGLLSMVAWDAVALWTVILPYYYS